MNLRKLLALDPSFMESGDGAGRYRMTKHNLLPEFGNSGAEIPATPGAEGAAAAAPAQKAVIEKAIEKPTEKRKRRLSLLGFRIQLPFSKPALVRPEAKSTLPTSKPTLKGGIVFQTEAIEHRKSEQANHLLSQVTVVRNDLNDAGVEVLALRRPAATGKQQGTDLAPEAGEPPVPADQTKVPAP